MAVYPPSDDSYLLAEVLSSRKCRRFLDMGCGSGIQAESIGSADEIVCADISKEAVDEARARVKRSNTRFIVSDLFSSIPGKFDLIAFNTPYLDDSEPRDIAWTHMQGGSDVIIRFLNEAKERLEQGGAVLIGASDREYGRYRSEAIRLGYTWEVVAEKALFFEKIFVVELRLHE
ncbi:MAG: methyltransferase [Candidatus Micrarchaeota archaeon]|nr:methyltransferase [Candidatus Micrarchaeota archaeon]